MQAEDSRTSFEISKFNKIREFRRVGTTEIVLLIDRSKYTYRK